VKYFNNKTPRIKKKKGDVDEEAEEGDIDAFADDLFEKQLDDNIDENALDEEADIFGGKVDGFYLMKRRRA
jgi:hypothetical protein